MSAEGLTININKSIVANEAEAQTGVRPVKCAISKNTSENDIETTWMVAFTEEIANPFRLFAHSINFSRSHRNPKITQCKRCLGFYGRNYWCEREICPNCAGTTYEGTCQKIVPKCINCSGPHTATSETCPARPKIRGEKIHRPTIDQLKEIRLARARARSHAHNKAKKVAAIEKTNGAEEVIQNKGSQQTDFSTVIEVDRPAPVKKEPQPDKNPDTIVVRQ